MEPFAYLDRALKKMDDALREMDKAFEALPAASVAAPGCICPPTSEKTCQALVCPRQRPGSAK